MEIFKKRETTTQNIAYMAIMAAINILFVLLTNILPPLMLLLVFILPLTSTIVTLLCKKRYYFIYALATLALCIAVGSGFHLFDTLIYIVPSLVVGFIFGFCLEKNVPAILILVFATLAQLALMGLTSTTLGILTINYSITNALINFFGLTNHPYNLLFIEIFYFIVAQIQIVFTYLVIKSQISKIGISFNLECKNRYWLYIVSLTTIFLSIISYLFFPDMSTLFVIFPILIYVYELIELLLKRKIYLYISLASIHLGFIFLFAFLYQYLLAPNQLIVIVFLTGSVTIIDFLDNYCFIKKSK